MVLGQNAYNVCMGKKIIFHGSDHVVESPSYGFEKAKSHNDYGLGFYCTQELDMAKEWANRSTQNGFANKYSIDERGLKILDLCDKSKYNVLNWIAILLHNRELSEDDRLDYEEELAFLERYYVPTDEYDVVIGYRADDAYFRFPLMFVRGVLTYAKLETIYALGDLGKQYALVSEKAFRNLRFIDAIPAEPNFQERYWTRKDSADRSYRTLEREEKRSRGIRIRDLMEEK